MSTPANVDVKIVSAASSPDGSAVRAEVIVDGSSQLLKEGNKYLSSEAWLSRMHNLYYEVILKIRRC